MSQDQEVRVLVVEDHEVVRWAIKNLLKHQGISVVGEASCASEVVDVYVQCKPDVVIMDLDLAEGNGIEATRALIEKGCVNVIAFTAFDSPENLAAFIQAGGVGFIPKSAPIDELAPAIHATLAGQRWLCDTDVRKPEQQGPQIPGLSIRESEIVALMLVGLSSSRIAEQLFLSHHTVKTHKQRIFQKLDVHNKAELFQYVTRHGIINIRPSGPSGS